MLARPCRTAVAAVRRLVRFNSTAATSTGSGGNDAPPDGIPEHVFASTIFRGRASMSAYQHPQTHGIPVALIHFRSYFPHLLDQFLHFTSHTAAALAIPISRPAHLPTQRTLWTVPRGPFVHKKAQENFDRRVHKRAIKAWDAHPAVVERWVRYLEEHAMAGVGIRVVRWQRAPVGVGEKVLERVMGQMRVGAATKAEKVKALGEKIVQQELAAASPVPEIVQPADSPSSSSSSS
ncbi:ribosomal protein S10 [Sparassis latifolia]|uniref:37S ribosomal protein S10, mitochondrial n=1 Tax=Sparassis crispa TaxID=139825 RepID=A0A401GU85_9APHY|nr:37S ribosomal protein S10, mitochondrial [Sparassis crispa]GBE85750.1 37S ribosomal protein S10, mitochondrial [Sparassis crispa]